MKPRVQSRVKAKERKVFDKYALYRESVQSAETDVHFIRRVYREVRGKDPITLREDFCGTFGLCCEWIKLHSKHKAVGIDLDPEPIYYGKKHYLPELKPDQAKRLKIRQANLLDRPWDTADVVTAMNFSYFIFQTRPILVSYFKNVRKSLKPKGVFLIDLFGGSLCYSENEESSRKKGFTYYWHQLNYEPIQNRAQFSIHFKLKDRPKMKHVFRYDWRMWTIPELRELLAEAGFKRTHVYWEGNNKKGGGSGVFRRTEKGEDCQSWIAYIAAEI